MHPAISTCPGNARRCQPSLAVDSQVVVATIICDSVCPYSSALLPWSAVLCTVHVLLAYALRCSAGEQAIQGTPYCFVPNRMQFMIMSFCWSLLTSTPQHSLYWMLVVSQR